MDDAKARILKSARHIFAEKGYDKATIREIAEHAQVARGLLHYHFKNKDDLLVQVMSSNYYGTIGSNMMEQLQFKTTKELAKTIVFVYQEALIRSPEFFQLIYGTISTIRQNETVRKAIVAVWQEYRNMGQTMINDLKKKGLITSKTSSEIILTLLVGVLHGIGIQVIGEPHMKLTNSKKLWEAIEKNVLSIISS